MLNTLCDDLPKLSSKEIQARCQAIRMNWSGVEKTKRKLECERRVRVLDRKLRSGSVEVAADRSYAKLVQFARLIAG